MKTKPIYLLDACMPITEEEKKSGLYVQLKQVANQHLPDHIVLKVAVEKQLVVITKDKGMITKAIIMGVNIIFQEPWGRRYYCYTSKTKCLGQVTQKYPHYESRLERTVKIISKVITPKICMSGFYQITCL